VSAQSILILLLRGKTLTARRSNLYVKRKRKNQQTNH